jgi:nucleotide-binding universal stress UspA family protein
MRILLAYDGSAGADAALDDLPNAGLPAKADALVLSAADVLLLPGGTSDPAPYGPAAEAAAAAHARAMELVSAAQQTADGAAERLRTGHPGWNVQAEASADSPAWAIIKRAEAWPADLTIVGCRGQSALARAVLGSVSLMVVSELRRSTRVARARQRSTGPLRVLVGADGSADAAAAVRAAAARSWPAKTEFCVSTIVDGVLSGSVPYPVLPSDSNVQTWAQHTADEAARLLRDGGHAVTTSVEWGDPRRTLPELAKRWEADCIFVGARGLRRVERFVLGSVSTAVAMRARCSVEITHAAAGP